MKLVLTYFVDQYYEFVFILITCSFIVCS